MFKKNLSQKMRNNLFFFFYKWSIMYAKFIENWDFFCEPNSETLISDTRRSVGWGDSTEPFDM